EFEGDNATWERWYENRVFPMPDGGVAVHFRDITGRKRVEEEVRTAAPTWSATPSRAAGSRPTDRRPDEPTPGDNDGVLHAETAGRDGAFRRRGGGGLVPVAAGSGPGRAATGARAGRGGGGLAGILPGE